MTSPSEPVPDADLRSLARNLSAVLADLHRLVPPQGSGSVTARLDAHLGVECRGLPVISQEFPPYQLVDVNVALDAWPSAGPARSAAVIGVSGDQRRFHPLSEMVGSGRMFGIGVGPVEYHDLPDSPHTTRSCVQFGIFLLAEGERRGAALVRGADPHGPMQHAMVELIADDPGWGRAVLAELRSLAVERSVLRGQVLALGAGEGQQYGDLRFLQRPSLAREELVLPDATLSQIERVVVGVAVHGARLLAAGQHLKRGALLYGPPGTGKTHTVRYLLSHLPERTAFVLSGQSLRLIGYACGLARLLQPSVVILEDVDLVAGDRSFGPVGANPLLFEVLNHIDGLGDDVDVTFLLTTNRVDILERALAERPGRVDTAVEIGVPDAAGRAQLLRLYGAGLGVAGVSDADLAGAVAATEGRTASYLREVVRLAALAEAERADGPLQVDGPALEAAATSLLGETSALTRALLGGAGDAVAGEAWAGEVTAGFTRRAGWRMGATGAAPPIFGPES